MVSLFKGEQRDADASGGPLKSGREQNTQETWMVWRLLLSIEIKMCIQWHNAVNGEALAVIISSHANYCSTHCWLATLVIKYLSPSLINKCESVWAQFTDDRHRHCWRRAITERVECAIASMRGVTCLWVKLMWESHSDWRECNKWRGMSLQRRRKFEMSL